MNIHSHISDCVVVLAADINDNLDVDGPVVDHMPVWFKEAAHENRITLVQFNESDYAHLKVTTPKGSHYAGPGDSVRCTPNGDLYVVTHSTEES